jgi:hypothetical protein
LGIFLIFGTDTREVSTLGHHFLTVLLTGMIPLSARLLYL